MEAELREAVLAVSARAAELERTWQAEADAIRAAAVRTRLVSGDTDGLLSVLPIAARTTPRGRFGRWLEDDSTTRFAGRVWLDAEGRALLHERVDDGYLLALWRYGREHAEEVHFWGGEPHVTWVLPALGAVGADRSDRWAERWIWEGGEVVRVERGRAAPTGWPHASAREAELDVAGRPRFVRTGLAKSDYREDNRLGEDEWLDALAAALERARELRCEKVAWIAARDTAVPLRDDVTGLGAWVGDALAEAIVAAAELPAPFCVQVSSGGDQEPLLPPSVLLADERWRSGNVAKSPGDHAAIDYLWQGVQSGAVAALDVTSRLGDDALRACAEISGALALYADPAEQARAQPVLDELADRLVARLAEPGCIPGASPEFLGLVLLGDRFGNDSVGAGLGRARRVLGESRVRAFTDTLRSQAPARRAPDAALAKRALSDRDALAELLTETGLAAHAERLAHEVAEVGLMLRESRGGVRSRLGGPALLGPDAEWPISAGGMPLSFLAGIDLAELPPGDGRPCAGWWLFFAALDYDDEEGEPGFYEPELNVPGAGARMFIAEAPVPADAPDGTPELDHRPVGFEPVLTLPGGFDAAGELGLDPYESRAYEVVLQALWEALGDESYIGGQPWIGGHVTGAQAVTPEAGTVLLLHLADDESLGFNFLDAGTIQFRIPAEALARGDYSAVEADPSSC